MRRLVVFCLLLVACEAPSPEPVPTLPVPQARSPRPTPTPAPTVDPATTTAVRGRVFGDATGVSVRIHCGRPVFDRVVPLAGNGNYATTGVPLRADLTFTLVRGDKTLLEREVQPIPRVRDVVINFGGPATPEDPDAPAFALPSP